MFVQRLLSSALLGLFTSCVALAQPQPQQSPTSTEQPHVVPRSTPPRGGPQITFNSVYVEQPFVALTFDDGPHATLTPKLLDILAARKVKATFFVTGKNAVEYPQIMKRIVAEGHELANHSWNHPNLGKMGDDAVRSQLQRTDDAIKAAAGQRTTLFRPPYGSITARQKQWIHESFGYRTIIWDVDPFDWKRPGPAVIRDRIVTKSKPGSIILLHDIHPGSIEAVPQTLEQLTAKGFKFATVSELLAMAKTPPPKPKATVTPIPHTVTGEPITRPTASPTPRRATTPAASAPSPAPISSPSPAEPAGTPRG